MSRSISEIEFIYFDVGGVGMLDFSGTDKWDELQDDLGLSGAGRKMFAEFFDLQSDEACRGLVDVDDFLQTLIDKTGLDVPPGYSLLQDFVDRFEKNIGLQEIVDGLQQNYRLGLLTNMYLRMFDKIQQRDLLPKADWEVVIDSSSVHMVKPEAQIFHLATQKAGVAADNILFIDNTQCHLDAAAKLG